MEQKSVCVLNNLTCPRRNLDAMKYVKYFEANNKKIVENPEIADYIIFFTCGFIKQATNSSLSTIPKLDKMKGELIVVGCLPGIEPLELESVFKGKTIITKDIETIDKFFEEHKVKYDQIEDQITEYKNFYSASRYEVICNKLVEEKKLQKLHMDDIKESEYKVLPIGTGCAGNCTYCSIKNATGKVKSRSVDICIEMLQKCLDNTKIIKIEGDDIGAYGIDINTNCIDLFKKLFETDKNNKIEWHFENFNPVWLVRYVDSLIEIFQDKKITYFACPIQTGVSRILKLMNRFNNIDLIAESLIKLRKEIPTISLNTSIIVGFPSETDEEFQETLEMIKKIGFSGVALLHYADRQYTKSYYMENKVDDEVIKKRLQYGKKVLEEAGIDVAVNVGY